MADLMYYLKYAVDNDASDLLIVAGGPVHTKIDGHIQPADDNRLLPPQTEELIRQIYEVSKRPMEKFLETWDDDFSFSVSGLARFRVNTYRQRGSLAAVVRVIRQGGSVRQISEYINYMNTKFGQEIQLSVH